MKHIIVTDPKNKKFPPETQQKIDKAVKSKENIEKYNKFKTKLSSVKYIIKDGKAIPNPYYLAPQNTGKIQ